MAKAKAKGVACKVCGGTETPQHKSERLLPYLGKDGLCCPCWKAERRAQQAREKAVAYREKTGKCILCRKPAMLGADVGCPDCIEADAPRQVEREKRIAAKVQEMLAAAARRFNPPANCEQRYGITADEAREQFRSQGCKCPVCRTNNGPWRIDHVDTASGPFVRGILCNPCNSTVLGKHGDTPGGLYWAWDKDPDN